MKVSEISKEQMKKLLKISKKLFPKYYCFENENEELRGFISFSEKKNNDVGLIDQSIHWYQLCIEVLPLKLCKSINNKKDIEGSSWSSIMFAINQNEHPIEGLWEEWNYFKNHLKK